VTVGRFEIARTLREQIRIAAGCDRIETTARRVEARGIAEAAERIRKRDVRGGIAIGLTAREADDVLVRRLVDERQARIERRVVGDAAATVPGVQKDRELIVQLVVVAQKEAVIAFAEVGLRNER
jgi:hypothetical protein